MTIVKYAGKKIIPINSVSIDKVYDKTGNGEIIGKRFQITLNGTIVAYKGSPDSSGTFHTSTGYPADEVIGIDSRLSAIQRKQEALRDLFSVEGSSLWIQSADEATAVTCNPRINQITFPEGPWHTLCPYTITLEADELYPKQEDTFADYLSDAQESWSITEEDTPLSLEIPHTWRVTHELSAVGKRFYSSSGVLDTEPYQHARNWVEDRLGFNLDMIPSSYNYFNYIKTENLNNQAGSFAATESWIISSGAYTEDFTVTTQDNLDSPFFTVDIQGSLQGLETNPSGTITSTKWENALSQFNIVSGLLYTRAQQYSGKSLGVTPVSWSIGKNPVAGSINYSYQYSNRPNKLFSNAKSEVINISNNIGNRSLARIFVIGRNYGPVIQDLSTYEPSELNINLEVVFDDTYCPLATGLAVRMNDYNPWKHAPESGILYSFLQSVEPVTAGYLNNAGVPCISSWIVQNSQGWNGTNLSLNRTYLYE